MENPRKKLKRKMFVGQSDETVAERVKNANPAVPEGEMSDIKASLKNIESLLCVQTESINQLIMAFKSFEEKGTVPRTETAPPTPPPPPPPIKPKPIKKDTKTQGHDAMFVELKAVLRKSKRPSQIKALVNIASNTKQKSSKPPKENVSLKPVADFQKVKLRSSTNK